MIWSRPNLFLKPFLAVIDKHPFRCIIMGHKLVSHKPPPRSQHRRHKCPPTDHRRPAANTPPAGGPRRRPLFVLGDRPTPARTDTSAANSRHLDRCPRSGRRATRHTTRGPSRSSGRGCSAPWLPLSSGGGGGACSSCVGGCPSWLSSRPPRSLALSHDHWLRSWHRVDGSRGTGRTTGPSAGPAALPASVLHHARREVVKKLGPSRRHELVGLCTAAASETS